MSERPRPNDPPEGTWIDLIAIFGPSNGGKHWHRVSERVSKLNRLARPYGVRLEVAQAQGRLLVRHRASLQLRRFQSKLSQGSGAIQRAVADALEKRISADPSHHAKKIAEFAKLQLQELPTWVGKPLQFALGLSREALFIDPPYSFQSAAGTRGPLRQGVCAFLKESLARERPFHGLVVAEPGGGKTAALYCVFQELSRQYLAGQLKELPLLIPAAYAEIQGGRLCWSLGRVESHLRDNPEVAEALRLLESKGRVIFLIDGLDENPGLIDASRTEVVKAWHAILQNRCVTSCRSRFFSHHFEGGGPGGKLSGQWSVIALADWRAADAKVLYRNLAACPITPPAEARATAGQLKSAFAHLAKLSEKGVPLGAFRATPLNLWLQSLFVASNRGLLPRNEYELLEFVAGSICRWQAAKKNRVVPLKTMIGLLSRAAWASYSAGHGERRFTKYGELSALIEAQWPSLLPRKEEVIAELEAHPILDCDTAHGLLWIDPHFMDYLAARHLIQTLSLRDIARVAEQFTTPVLWDVSRYFDEGMDCLTENERATVTSALIDAFAICREQFERHKTFRQELALNQLGYHLGRTGLAQARQFLHGVLDDRGPALKSEICHWAIVIGLALSGDDSVLGRYVQELEKRPKAFALNMAYCQVYFLDKRASVGGFEEALKRPSPVWDKTCDAILAQLASKTFKRIRPLDLLSLRRFIELLGPQPFVSELGSARKAALRSVLTRLRTESGVDKTLAAQCARLQKTLAGIV